MNGSVQKYLVRVLDYMQYPVAAGSLRGQKGSSAVEAGKHSITDSREGSFVCSLLQLARNMKQQFDTQKSMDLNISSIIPPRNEKILIDRKKRLPPFTSGTVQVNEENGCNSSIN